MYTATTPMTVKSLEPFEMDASVNAPSATTGATTEEEDVVADAGMTMAHARSGATSLVRTTGRTSLAKVPGGISLATIVLRAMLASLRYHHHREGMMTTTKMTGLGASKSLVPSPAS